ncbi:hypothetical protein Leryth_019728 [Lithospermum erythrorhizon]|nr:hypothetical protein Leryth_019728 [Lithospermum erythrorhizon]
MIPLFSTAMVLQLIISLISFVVGILAVLFYTSYNEYFTLTMILLVLITFVYVTYIQLNFFVANVVVVVESKWGYAPLKRSAYLMKGAKMVGLKMIMLGVLNSLFVWSCFLKSWKADGDEFWVWMLFRMVVGSFWMTVVLKYYLVANVVLYIYCMKLHGELAMEIHAQEYVSLLIDDNGNKSVC